MDAPVVADMLGGKTWPEDTDAGMQDDAPARLQDRRGLDAHGFSGQRI